MKTKPAQILAGLAAGVMLGGGITLAANLPSEPLPTTELNLNCLAPVTAEAAGVPEGGIRLACSDTDGNRLQLNWSHSSHSPFDDNQTETLIPYDEQFAPTGRTHPIPADEHVRLDPASPLMGGTSRWAMCAGGDLFRITQFDDHDRLLLLVSRDVDTCQEDS